MLMDFILGKNIANAVGDPERVSLLKGLSSGEKTAEDLLGEYPGPADALLRQLTVLQEAFLVESRTDGVSVLYRVPRASRGILRNLLDMPAESSAPMETARGASGLSPFAV